MSKPMRHERRERQALRARQYAIELRRDILAKRCPETAKHGSILDGFGRADTITARPYNPGSSLFHGRQHRS